MLAAEVKILVQGIAYWPAAIAWQKRLDRLSLFDRYFQVIVLRQAWGKFDATHGAAYTKCPGDACQYSGLWQSRLSGGERHLACR